MKQLFSLKYVMRQGLGVQVHVQEESYLFQLFKCRSEDVPPLGWLSDGRYTDPMLLSMK